MRVKIPNNATNFLMEILRRSIAAQFFPLRVGQDNTSTLIFERAAAHLHGMIDALEQKAA